jgi:hypothetical protein
MNIDFAVVCDYALVDQFGKLSVIGMFHHIWVADFPAVHPRLHLVIRLRGRRTEVGRHDVLIRLVGDDGSEILRGDGSAMFAEPPAGVTEIEAASVLVFDVAFPRAGRYHFEITVDGQTRASVPLAVGLAPRSPAPEATSLN